MCKFFNLLLVIIVLFLIQSCASEPKGAALIYGKWKALKWEPMGMDVSRISFEFKPDSIYIANMGETKEQGTYNLNSNCFNAFCTTSVNKKCPILKLTQDTMIWMMDSVQQEGNLYLIRVKE
jgi:hypothetical protein